jgi:hypothetical protein
MFLNSSSIIVLVIIFLLVNSLVPNKNTCTDEKIFDFKLGF